MPEGEGAGIAEAHIVREREEQKKRRRMLKRVKKLLTPTKEAGARREIPLFLHYIKIRLWNR